MSRRDIVVNTLLGILLLGIPLAIFLAFMGAVSLALSAIKYLAGHFLPGLVLPTDLLLLLIYGVSAVACGVGHLRRKLWRNAFLCLAIIPVIILSWLGHPFSIFGGGDYVSLWMVCILLLAAERSPVPRSEFFLAALIVSAVALFASGLVGTGELAHIVSIGTGAASIVLLITQTRRRQATEDRDTAAPAVA
jgi:hypothetical protein